MEQLPQKNNILLPVIHTLDEKQVLENAEVAFRNGADGVMLNNHPSPMLHGKYGKNLNTTEELIHTFVASIRRSFPEKFIGINDLQNYNSPEKIFPQIEASGINAVRVDKPFINGMMQQHMLGNNIDEIIRIIQTLHSRKGVYMGGVNFKYVDEYNHLSKEELIALAPKMKSYLDIIVTTGSGTGKAIDIEKLKMFSEIFGQENVALASGVNTENYRMYQEYAKIFLIATGIQQKTGDHSRDFHYLDSKKIANMASQMKAHNIYTDVKQLRGQKISQELIDIISTKDVINISYKPNSEGLSSALSNLAPYSFVLDNVEYASVEGFRMSIKFPLADPRRIEARSKTGIEAKKFGDPMQGVDKVFYQGKEITMGSHEHHALLKRALRAKIEQNPLIRNNLISSGYSTIIHIPTSENNTIYPDSSTIPSKIFSQILYDLREEFRKSDSSA